MSARIGNPSWEDFDELSAQIAKLESKINAAAMQENTELRSGRQHPCIGDTASGPVSAAVMLLISKIKNLTLTHQLHRYSHEQEILIDMGAAGMRSAILELLEPATTGPTVQAEASQEASVG